MSSIYHRISNRIHKVASKYPRLMYLVALPFVIIDLIGYIIYPLDFLLARKEACGEIFYLGGMGIYDTRMDTLLDSISRASTVGIQRLRRIGALPFADSYDFPFAESPTGNNISDHIPFRQLMLCVRDRYTKQVIDSMISDFIKGSMNKDRLFIGNDANSKRFIYDIIFGIDTSDIDLAPFDKPRKYMINVFLANLVPQRFLKTPELERSVTKLSQLLMDKLNINEKQSRLLITGIEITWNGITRTLYKTFEYLQKNPEYANRFIETGDVEILRRCIIESTRFLNGHPGISLVETLESERVLTPEYTAPAGSTLILSIAVSQWDTKHIASPEIFNPERSEIDLIRKTMFYGMLNDNLNNRSCPFQYTAMSILTQVVAHILNNYTWEKSEMTFAKIPTLESELVLNGLYPV